MHFEVLALKAKDFVFLITISIHSPDRFIQRICQEEFFCNISLSTF